MDEVSAVFLSLPASPISTDSDTWPIRHPQTSVSSLTPLLSAWVTGGSLAVAIVRRSECGQVRISYANDALARLTLYPVEQLPGRLCDFLRGPETAADVSETIDVALRRDMFADVEALHYRANGTRFWNGLTICPVAEAAIERGTFVLLMRDITARRRAGDRMTVLADRLRDLAMSDPLTGIANRRSFDAALLRAWRRAERKGGSIALSLVDIDHFKNFNDMHGHPVGDVCLRAVALALNDAVGAHGNLVARYGGEEFAILMPNSGTEDALHMAERMVAAVRTVRCEGGSAVTISCGVVVADPVASAFNFEHFIREADHALYQAKTNGRNCVHMAASIRG